MYTPVRVRNLTHLLSGLDGCAWTPVPASVSSHCTRVNMSEIDRHARGRNGVNVEGGVWNDVTCGFLRSGAVAAGTDPRPAFVGPAPLD